LGFKLDNPLSSEVDTLPEFLYEIIHIFLIVGVPIVALAIIYCGFLFVIARGNSEKLSEAKKALGYTLLGAAILLGAFVISNIIQSTVDDIQDATVRIFDESELA
jgi:lipopolysaccharide export LptBFGC system permease protein LptF